MKTQLTEEDAMEIYYALDSKATAVLKGEYGPHDSIEHDCRWAAHLREIMCKIGPDGAALVGIELEEGDNDED